MKLRFVTGNPGKAREAAAKLAPLGVEVEPVAATVDEIQADTLEAVARAKAEALRGVVRPPYFVEDAGLFVEALAGFPGVYSAYVFRTLGCDGVLRLVGRGRRRAARFEAVVALVTDASAPRLFTGRCDGTIAPVARGDAGFGFDPIFVPEGGRRTFAEMPAEAKARVSHRGRALEALVRHFAAPKPSRKG